MDGKPFDLRQRLLRPGLEILQSNPELLVRIPGAGGLLGQSLHQGFGVQTGADLRIEERVRSQLLIRLGGGEEAIDDLGVLQLDKPPGKMPVEERDRQEGTLAGAEVEQEGFLGPQEEGADDDRLKLLGELVIRPLEAQSLGLMGVEPDPTLAGRIVVQTAELLERPQQPRAVPDLVMQPDRLEVLARHGGQEGLIRHFRGLTKSWTSRVLLDGNGWTSWSRRPVCPGRWR